MLIIQCARCPRESRYRNSVWRLRMQLPHLTRFQIFHLSATANVATGFAASEPRPYTLSKFRFENSRRFRAPRIRRSIFCNRSPRRPIVLVRSRFDLDVQEFAVS